MDIGDAGLTRASVFVLIFLFLAFSSCHATQENDLWLLLSTYEDIGITVKDLAFFLATHGFDAEPEESYVVVKFAGGKEAYLTPNGAAPRLADLWMTPPTAKSGPVQVLSSEAVKINRSYEKTNNKDFIKTIERYQMFPVAPLGLCYDGSQKLHDIYESFGYKAMYVYDPSGFDSQGHLWIAVEDKDHPNSWLAVDSYYGVMTDDQYYYTAPYSFEDFKYLDSINPKWRMD